MKHLPETPQQQETDSGREKYIEGMTQQQEKIQEIQQQKEGEGKRQETEANKLKKSLFIGNTDNTLTKNYQLLTCNYDRDFEKKLKNLQEDGKEVDILIKELSNNEKKYETIIKKNLEEKGINDEEIIKSSIGYIQKHIKSENYVNGKYGKSIKNFIKILRGDTICFKSNKEGNEDGDENYIFLEKRMLRKNDIERFKDKKIDINEDKPILQLHLDKNIDLNDIYGILIRTADYAEKFGVQPYIYCESRLLDTKFFNFYGKINKKSNIVKFQEFCKGFSIDEIEPEEKLTKERKKKFIKEGTSLKIRMASKKTERMKLYYGFRLHNLVQSFLIRYELHFGHFFILF